MSIPPEIAKQMKLAAERRQSFEQWVSGETDRRIAALEAFLKDLPCQGCIRDDAAYKIE